MKAEQLIWKNENKTWESTTEQPLHEANLVLAFGSTDILSHPERVDELKERYPKADIAICSTSGEIYSAEIYDDSVTAVAFCLEKTPLRAESVIVEEGDDGERAGACLGKKLQQPGLKHVFILSDGQAVNGSALIRGLCRSLPNDVSITGGLAGDADRFAKTLVGLNQTPVSSCIVAIGFYGEHIQVSFGSKGGWIPFGAIRTITKADANVLYELDGKPALELYKTYLGDKANGLPGTALLFPIAILQKGEDPIVRTILSINEKEGSLTFAGEMPEGAEVQLMRANLEGLIDGAAKATESIDLDCSVAILISCVGRRLVLGQRTEDELEQIRQAVGPQTIISGFYSYGEVCPTMIGRTASLHNQTMTITTFAER